MCSQTLRTFLSQGLPSLGNATIFIDKSRGGLFNFILFFISYKTNNRIRKYFWNYNHIWKYWGCFLENTGSSEFLTHLPHYGTVTYLRSTGNQWQELVWLLRILWLLTPNYWINRIYFSPALTVEEDVGLRIPGNLVYWSLSRELSYSQRMYKSQTL